MSVGHVFLFVCFLFGVIMNFWTYDIFDMSQLVGFVTSPAPKLSCSWWASFFK